MNSANGEKRKIVLLSGGSRGLGLHCAQALLSKGHVVSTFARKGTPETSELASQYPKTFRFAAKDAREAAGVGDLVRGVSAEFGRIDVLINNAAVGQDHLLAHMPPDLITTILEVNLHAPILLTRAVVRQMLLQESGGRIINVSSICGSRGYTGLSVYSATKGAMDAFTRSLAREVGQRGILVNSIAPGFFESEMSSVLSPDQLSTIRRRTSTGRLTTPDEVVELVEFLIDRGSNVNGQTFFVDGGISA